MTPMSIRLTMACPWAPREMQGQVVPSGRPAQAWLERAVGMTDVQCACCPDTGQLWRLLGDSRRLSRGRWWAWLERLWGITPAPAPAPEPMPAQAAPRTAWQPVSPAPVPEPKPALPGAPAAAERPRAQEPRVTCDGIPVGGWRVERVEAGLHRILVGDREVGRVMRRASRQWLAATCPKGGVVSHAVQHETLGDAVQGLSDLVGLGVDAYRDRWEREPVAA